MAIKENQNALPVHVHTKPRIPITISKMRPSDIESVARLERQCHVLAWNANAFATELSNPVASYYVAKTEDGSLAGYGGIWVVVDELHITTISSDPQLRGQGVGDKLLLVLIAEGIRLGATRATLEVRESNLIAQRLYEKYGFKNAAKRRQYYADNRENAIIMWAEGISTQAYAQFLIGRRSELFGQ
jgi:ribosomal-protein-alanine N-acetyltransferase